MNRIVLLPMAAALAFASVARATDFGVMETADYIEPRHFKFIAYPLFARPAARQEQGMGVAMGVGYGLAPGWDVEGLFASYDDASFVGTDVEFTFYESLGLDASVGLGSHFAETDFGDQYGVDLVHIASYRPHRLPRLTVSGAIDLAYDEVARTRGAVRAGMPDDHFTVHFAPGVQYRVTRDLDVVGEIGIGVNDDAHGYTGGGLSYYFR